MATLIALTLSGIHTMEEIAHWGRVAEAIGIPQDSSVEVSGVSSSLTVTCGLEYVPDPLEDQDHAGATE